jgi:PHD/YefM family antitoxin component YafN of YafNO toxin-antitoxin module
MRKGPVFISEGGRPAHVLLTIEDYRHLTGAMSLAEALAQPGDAANFEFEPPRIDLIVKTADPG